MAQDTLQKEAGVASNKRGGSLWLIGLLSIFAAIAANLLVRVIAFALLPLSETFIPLQPGATIMFTTIGIIGAVGVYALVRRFARKPVQTYLVIATIALLLSCIPDVLMIVDPATTSLSYPGFSVPAGWVLIAQHIVAAVVSVAILVTLVRPIEKRALT